jgi:ATP-dependent DNA helicase RecG
MQTTIQQLNAWINAPREDAQLEFKEARNQYDTGRLFRYCVAIANEGGGRLILGVTDKRPRKIVGTNAFQDPSDIQSKILDKLRFRVDIEEILHPDGRTLVFHIPSRPKGTAYQFEGAYLMRSTEDTVPMTEDRLRAIFDEGKPSWLSEIAMRDVSANHIVQLLDTQSYFDLLKLPYPINRTGVLERLVGEKLILESGLGYNITNLAALLFAKNIKEFDSVQRKSARVIVYEDKGKTQTKSDRTGSKGYAVGFELLMDYIGTQLPTNEIVGRALRENVQMYPEIAIRELVANALIHQDFNEIGTSVMIEIYSDRIEISNPGRPHIPPERFIDEYQSRNERLADIMRRMRICEEKGSGIDKVVESVEVFQLPAPDFRVGERHTNVVLFAHKSIEAMDSQDKIRACYQHCVLRYVMNERMTNQSLRERFKLSEMKVDYVSRVIRDTIEAGLIRDEDPESGSRRYARYVPFWV